MRRSTNVGLMLAHRLRRWTNIKPALSRPLLLAELDHSTEVDRIRIISDVSSLIKNHGDLFYYYLSISQIHMACPDGSFVSTGACNLGVPGSSPGRDGYLSSWLCIYNAPSVQRHGVYSAAYGTVHYKEPLNSLEIRVVHSPGFGFPSVALLP